MLQYVNRTGDEGICFPVFGQQKWCAPSKSAEIEIISINSPVIVSSKDLDWSGDTRYHKSRSGYLFMITGRATSRCSHTQRAVATAKYEAGYTRLGAG